MTDAPDDAVDQLLARLTEALPSGEDRPGQHEMARAVGKAIRRRRHLVVQAGTGTGKSLAYLAPALALGRKVVVATATKALQDQLAGKELPFLADHLDRDISWAVLKGRSNYLCRQRLDEVAGDDTGQGDLGLGPAAQSNVVSEKQVTMLKAFAARSSTGDRADLDVEPSERTWAAVSVGPRECPGANKCPRGEDCFAEMARKRAATADVVVVNTHLYGLHLASDGMILPQHDVAIFDEAHEVADIISATTGLELGAGRFMAAARIAASLIAEDNMVDDLETIGLRLSATLAPLAGSRLRRGIPNDVADVLSTGRARLDAIMGAARKIESGASAEVTTRVAHVLTSVTALIGDIDTIQKPPDDTVMWVQGDTEHPRLSLAPLDVGRTLDELLWNPEATGLEIVTEHDQAPEGPVVPHTVVFTSATVPATLVADLRIPAGQVDSIDVGTPFDFEHQALLYCPTELPDPRKEAYRAALFDELERLINAAGGRTLALFTSHRMMRDAADELTARIDHPVLRQGELPKPKLVERFTEDEASCLFATMGYWQGIDVPGPSLTLVTIDKIPFPRPDDPLLQARREAVGSNAFRVIDLPRASTLLAQGAGRLIRHRNDRGVVAVLDPRLATSPSYRWDLIGALPPMKRTKDFTEVAAFLADS